MGRRYVLITFAPALPQPFPEQILRPNKVCGVDVLAMDPGMTPLLWSDQVTLHSWSTAWVPETGSLLFPKVAQ